MVSFHSIYRASRFFVKFILVSLYDMIMAAILAYCYYLRISTKSCCSHHYMNIFKHMIFGIYDTVMIF